MVDKNLAIIFTMTFTDLMAVGLVFPVLQAHVRSLGGTSFFIGVLGSTYSTIQVISGPIVGSWSDVRGRKPVLFLTLLFCSIFYFSLGLTRSFYVLFFVRVLLGIFKHTQTLCKAFIADLYPQSDHTSILGRSAAFGSIGFVVGPIIGGHLSEFENGFFYITILTSLLFVINIVLTLWMPVEEKKDTKTAQDRASNSVIESVQLEIRNVKTLMYRTNWSHFWDAFLLRFLFGLSISIYFSNQALFIQEKFNLSQKYIGYTISFLSIIGVISAFGLGKIKDYFYENDKNCLKRLLHGFTIFAICFLGLSFSSNLYAYLCFLVPFSIASTILRNVSMELIIQKSEKTEKGSLSGASNSLMSVSRSISPIIVGAISTTFGDKSVMITAFIPSLIGMVTCILLKYKSAKHYHID